MDSKVAYAMERYEAMDYGRRSGFDPSRYLNPEWMAKRMQEGEHVLGGHDYTYKNWGSIRFHKPAGNEEVRYNIQYDSDMKLEFYIMGYNTLGISTVTTYRTSKEMMAAILDAFNKKYH